MRHLEERQQPALIKDYDGVPDVPWEKGDFGTVACSFFLSFFLGGG